MSRRVLQFGASGQLGRALISARPGWADLVALDRAAAEFTRPETLSHAVRTHEPEVVIIAAAYTNVDRAESEPDIAEAVNAAAPGIIGQAAAAIGASVLHVSTDYVFDGVKGAPYLEGDTPSPVNIYGKTKLQGEQSLLDANPRGAVLRASWVFSPVGRNFLNTMLRLGAERDSLRIVDDQISAPTPADDLAAVLWTMAERVGDGEETAERFGNFHLPSAPPVSWAAFADAIFARSEAFLGKRPDVARIPSAAYPTPAARPLDTRLGGARLYQSYGVSPIDWRAGLDRAIAEISAQRAASKD